MADKVVKKEAKTEVKSDVKKGRRRLKRSVRKTLGALFLATAIAVAAIPVDGLQAAPTEAHDGDWGTLDENMQGMGSVPFVDKSEQIYTTGDGVFQFAYVAPGGAGSKVAVILGYNNQGSLEGGALTIPNQVDAYAQRTDNQGTKAGYTAIGKSQNFLYYKHEYQEQSKDKDGQLEWLDPDKTQKKMVTITEYLPCDADDPTWLVGRDTDTAKYLSNFYYFEDSDLNHENPKQTTDSDYQWMTNITVGYIGNQYLVSDAKTGWKIPDDADSGRVTSQTKDIKGKTGVFAGAGNIVHLTVGKDMMGIGDYAFYGCTNLQSITLNNGLNTIGVGAFAKCANMHTANIDVSSMVNVIGDYAFYDCRALTSFTVPNQVSRIGNSAFEGCENLATFTMGAVNTSGTQQNGLLTSLGARVFKNCSSLKSLSFQSQFAEKVNLSAFEGCTSLECIEVKNSSADFVVVDDFTYDKFRATVKSTFYFKGLETSDLHDTARENQVAFSYTDSTFTPPRDVYEVTVKEDDGTMIVYRVDGDNQLVYCDVYVSTEHPELNEFPETVTLPEQIGPHYIKVIDSRTFQNQCNINRITIPSTITGIASEAFKGCHNLEWVIFNNPSPNLTIGLHAFQTQEGYCKNKHTLKDKPELNFVGPISYDSEPFDYAMRKEETIDNGSQPTTYIKYYATWPSLVAVQYNPDKDENELVDYPTLTEMANPDGRYSGKGNPYLNEKPEGSTDNNAKTKAQIITNAIKTYTENLGKNVDGKNVDWKTNMSSDEIAVIDAAINLVLPKGIEGIATIEGVPLFAKYEDGNEISETFSNVEKTIIAESIINIDDEAFKGHKRLTSIIFSDATVSVGNHAFEGCEKLANVSLPGTVEKMGTRPFADCKKLSNVNFNGGPYFTCENSIIFELASGNTKSKIVECLEGRVNPMIDAKETAGVTELYPEAFMGTGVITVDLSSSRISEVPESCFENTKNLATVTLPSTINGGAINKNAFRKSAISVIRIPGQFINIDQDAFTDADHLKEDDHSLIFWCDEVKDGERNMAAEWATQHGLTPQYSEPEVYYSVRFFYYDDDDVAHQIGQTQRVLIGHSAEEPDAPEKPGYTFEGFFPQTWKAVTGNVDAYARYKENGTEMFTVIFQDYNGKEILKQTVAKGGSVIVPQSPSRMDENPPWVFDGWVLSGGNGEFLTQQSSSLTNVQSNMVLIAQYHLAKEGETVDPGTGKTPSPSPGTSGSPNPGTSGSPSPGTSGSPSPGTSGSPGPGGALYTLTVVNGSGSGSYVEGSQPFIIANAPATGQVFDHWSISPEDVKIASTALSASIITMPAKDVTVTAHFKAGSGSGNGSGSTGSGNNAQRPNGSGSVTNGGTTVVIDKNGLSNTGVVSATVHGSSDNFTIKITESAEATEAALRALMAEYGDDLTNFKYFPMDISLYDSTGTYKITDTTGLSVAITLPLPDSMITYAGNNKVASTVGGRIERLDARFSTIQGVSCITFTAEHFSPYMIYVDLGNLSSGLVSDETPKTGDGIHPKWFLSIGLACLSMILFMQKDSKKQPKKVKVKVRSR